MIGTIVVLAHICRNFSAGTSCDVAPVDWHPEQEISAGDDGEKRKGAEQGTPIHRTFTSCGF
jgi:hypothetical protein